MHTEKTNSIREARHTLNQVKLLIPTLPIGHASRELLELTAIELESLIWQLVHEDLKLVTENLKNHQQRLQELSEELNSRTASIGKVTKLIENVSKMIGSLAGMASLFLGLVFSQFLLCIFI